MPPADSHDKQLMIRVASGDKPAFRELVSRHQNTVFAIAYRYLGDAADAEEIAQEAFCRLYAAAGRYRPEAAFRTNLLRIVTNLCSNRRARAYRRREESRNPGDLDIADDTMNPRSAVLAAERCQALRDAVAALPDEQRITLILARFEGLSYEEISALTGRSVSSVTSTLWRARASLRRSLDKWVQESSPDPVTTSRSK